MLIRAESGVHSSFVVSLRVAVPALAAKTLTFDRPKGRDFSERDRLALNLFRPLLSYVWEAARTRRLLRAALAELDRTDDHDSRGVILLGLRNEREFASPPARRLLREFFPATGSQLPAALTDWLDAGANQPLIRRRGERRLIVRRSTDSLFLEERHQEVQLTARECDVLSWVARGKTNAEIAERLGVAPGTVRKHLENVYAKLGVSTRTAAMARFLGLTDAEAS
jgi:DNA-binding CsgD family transcriptional regulator